MAFPQCRLILKRGGEIGTVYPLEADEVYIGRDSGNDIVLAAADVSRRHARLRRLGKTFAIEDLGSTNGTFVAGERVTSPRPLEHGVEIRLGGQVVFVFEVIAPQPPAHPGGG